MSWIMNRAYPINSYSLQANGFFFRLNDFNEWIDMKRIENNAKSNIVTATYKQFVGLTKENELYPAGVKVHAQLASAIPTVYNEQGDVEHLDN